MTKPNGARRKPWSPAVAMDLAGVVLACWLALSSPGALAAADPNTAQDASHAPAHAARTMHATDEAHLLYIRTAYVVHHISARDELRQPVASPLRVLLRYGDGGVCRTSVRAIEIRP